jgi:hypothetical protein
MLPIDDYRDDEELQELRALDANVLEANNRNFWEEKLDQSGLQVQLPQSMTTYWDLYRICRANLLILADGGQIHPGPTIYDSFWVRDSSVEGIACALAGDGGLTFQQFGTHYLQQFHTGNDRWGPVSLQGFFGGEHEKNDHEWDSNGQALWAFGRFDRISGEERAFGKRVFQPYVVQAARWIYNNRSEFGLLHSGWSAEHLGDKDKPHYWDDFWGLAGLWEAAKLAERIQAPEAGELWHIYDDLRIATVNSIRWVLTEQRRRGYWETFIPTGPADVGRLDSTIIGAVAYFHPCRLYMGKKLGDDIDLAARLTLDTVWSHFVWNGGFEHNSAWNAFGPYLTLQLAHAYLYLGDIDKMEVLLSWSVFNAAFAKDHVAQPSVKQIVLGAWNEQHCYPVASGFTNIPNRPWYMGDIPHGWACAEFLLLLREMLFFECDEDNDPHLYLAAGVLPKWMEDGEVISVRDAPTIFGVPFGFTLALDKTNQKLILEISEGLPAHVRYVFPCYFGQRVRQAIVDGQPVQVNGREVLLPGGFQRAEIFYEL